MRAGHPQLLRSASVSRRAFVLIATPLSASASRQVDSFHPCTAVCSGAVLAASLDDRPPRYGSPALSSPRRARLCGPLPVLAALLPRPVLITRRSGAPSACYALNRNPSSCFPFPVRLHSCLRHRRPAVQHVRLCPQSLALLLFPSQRSASASLPCCPSRSTCQGCPTIVTVP